MIYCDASLLVALLVDEPHSIEAHEWLRRQVPTELVASDWAITEVGSALAFKLRLGLISIDHHRAAVAGAERMLAAMVGCRVDPSHFVAAGRRHVLSPPTGLRSGDALHLAIVADHGFDLATFDGKFAEAARRSGVAVATILTD